MTRNSWLYRVATYDALGLRETSAILTRRDWALDHAATLIHKHARVAVFDDSLDVVAEWRDGEEVVGPVERAATPGSAS